MELRDETGQVVVRLDEDTTANGQRLRITSARTGEVAYLDALMIETLTWLPGIGEHDEG